LKDPTESSYPAAHYTAPPPSSKLLRQPAHSLARRLRTENAVHAILCDKMVLSYHLLELIKAWSPEIPYLEFEFYPATP
jgi:hypothetical protein